MSFHPTLDHETLKQRLITKEGQNLQSTRGSLSKCAMRMLEFTKATQTAAQFPDNEKLKSLGNELIRELKLHDLEMKKMDLGVKAAEAELANYDSIREQTKGSIVKARGEIDDLRAALEHEIKVRKNRQEYEALAKTARNGEPSRVTKRKLVEERTEIDQQQETVQKIQKKLNVKGKQFHLLMQSIADLKRGIDEEEMQGTIEKQARDGISESNEISSIPQEGAEN